MLCLLGLPFWSLCGGIDVGVVSDLIQVSGGKWTVDSGEPTYVPCSLVFRYYSVRVEEWVY